MFSIPSPSAKAEGLKVTNLCSKLHLAVIRLRDPLLTQRVTMFSIPSPSAKAEGLKVTNLCSKLHLAVIRLRDPLLTQRVTMLSIPSPSAKKIIGSCFICDRQDV
ncbi:Uncharacterised protein [Legionella gratiana]|uniref:Uncharacterized protein n=1 Tax=Legionella gratiana TaxID=45066 RepID=A0A378JE23_9GAMM|nr:Uncharacterised protein [Legionella gratiana]